MLQVLLDWSEVWSLLIPVAVLIKKPTQPFKYKPVIWYIWAALFINICIDITWAFQKTLPYSLKSNNYLYNLHSIVRFLLFSIFFNRLKQQSFLFVKKSIPIIFIGLVIVNFSFYERFFNYWQLSSRLLSVEAAMLLVYCLLFYFTILKEETKSDNHQSEFWIVTGVGIYVAVNFFIFLLYDRLTEQVPKFAVTIWNVHNITYIILNLFLAKAFYEYND